MNHPEKFASLFSTTATFSFPYRKIHLQTKEEMESLCKNLHSKFPTTTHWEGNVVIENISTDTQQLATNVSYWKAIREGTIISNGFHFDTFSKENGKWTFQERIVTLSWSLETGNINKMEH
jgi:hypothetical protein